MYLLEIYGHIIGVSKDLNLLYNAALEILREDYDFEEACFEELENSKYECGFYNPEMEVNCYPVELYE